MKEKLLEFLKEFNEVCKQCGRKGKAKIVFATKYLDKQGFLEFIENAKEATLLPLFIGENRVQEAEEKLEFIRVKSPILLESFNYIMIGTLQNNKINKAISIFDEIHSVDSLELARTINRKLENDYNSRDLLRSARIFLRTSQTRPSTSLGTQTVGVLEKLASPQISSSSTFPIFLEVNVSKERTKHGFSPEELDKAVKEIKLLKSLKLKGLMTMAPIVANPEEVRPVFRTLKKLADKNGLKTSMGMSSDWQVAVEEGADMIRVGRKIFGNF